MFISNNQQIFTSTLHEGSWLLSCREYFFHVSLDIVVIALGVWIVNRFRIHCKNKMKKSLFGIFVGTGVLLSLFTGLFVLGLTLLPLSRSSHAVVFDDAAISPFQHDELYECQGTCTCDERRNAGVIRKTTLYLVAAASSFLTMRLAREQLTSKCESEFDECSKVSSELGECRFIKNYLCTGSCNHNNHLLSESEYMICGNIGASLYVYGVNEETARTRFIKEELKPFCRTNSRVTHPDGRIISLCSAYVKTSSYTGYVECVPSMDANTNIAIEHGVLL